MTAETPWRLYKTITNIQRASDLPVARVLLQKNMQNNNGFEQVWPKIFNMIREKLVSANTFANYDYDNIDQEYFKKICREVYANTKKQWEQRKINNSHNQQ